MGLHGVKMADVRRDWQGRREVERLQTGRIIVNDLGRGAGYKLGDCWEPEAKVLAVSVDYLY
jgi:hypothetical protein